MRTPSANMHPPHLPRAGEHLTDIGRNDPDLDAEHLLAEDEARPVSQDNHSNLDAPWKTEKTHNLLQRFLQPLQTFHDQPGRQSNNLSGESNSESGKEARFRKARKRGVGRMTLTLVIAILALCGVVSIILAALGLLVMRQSIEEPFLPHWGEPGHLGEGLARYPTDFTRDIIPVPCHSHNDYWRRVPLYEAIHNGFIGVEADVWLLDGDLLVGHKESSLTWQRTFRSLYVDPIVSILDHQNPSSSSSHGARSGVFDTDPDQPLILLVDFKTSGSETLPVVQAQLEALRSKNYLTHFDGRKVVQGQVTVVGTGNTPFDMLVSNTTYRDIFFDAPLDLIWHDSEERRLYEGGISSPVLTPPREALSQGQGQTGIASVSNATAFTPLNSYYASVSFTDVFGWPQIRSMSKHQVELLRGQIRAAHRQGLRVRYWNTPSWPVGLRNSIWKTLVDEGVDILNADDLSAAAHGDWRSGQTWWFW